MKNKKIHLGIGKPKRPVSFALNGDKLAKESLGLAKAGVALAFTGLALGVTSKAFKNAFE